jgi:hypothetical protein
MRRRPIRRFFADKVVGVTRVAVAVVVGCASSSPSVHEPQPNHQATETSVAREHATEMPAPAAVDLRAKLEQLFAQHASLTIWPTSARLRHDAEAKLVLTSGDLSSTATVQTRKNRGGTPMSTGSSADKAGWIYDAVSIALLSGFGVFLLVQRARTKARADQDSVERVPPNAGAAGRDPAAITPAIGTPNATVHPMSDGPSSSAAVDGASSAKQALESRTGGTERPRLPEARPPQVRQQAHLPAVLGGTPGEVPPEIAAFLRSGGIPDASVHPDRPRIVIAGSGDAVVQVAMQLPGSVVHIVGNSASRYFGVQTLETRQSLVNTTDPYNGVRLLEADPDKSVALQVRATGPWAIEVLSAADVPSFDTSHTGHGDAAVRYSGGRSRANIVGNEARRYFGVRSISAQGVTSLVNTTQPHSQTISLNAGPQIFEIQAVGSWTISVT